MTENLRKILPSLNSQKMKGKMFFMNGIIKAFIAGNY